MADDDIHCDCGGLLEYAGLRHPDGTEYPPGESPRPPDGTEVTALWYCSDCGSTWEYDGVVGHEH